MEGITPIGWLAIVSAIALIGSLFVAQAADGERHKGLFALANVMTLGGVVGLVLAWLLS